MRSGHTIIGLRKGPNTVVACAGLRISPAGLILHHKSGRYLRRTYLDKVIVGSNMSEAHLQLFLDTLNHELIKTEGDIREAALELCRQFLSHPMFQSVQTEALVAAKDYLAIVTPEGELIEPEDGFVAIGSSAPIASGAMKALLTHSNLSSEQMVRESLRIASQLDPFAHNEISTETV